MGKIPQGLSESTFLSFRMERSGERNLVSSQGYHYNEKCGQMFFQGRVGKSLFLPPGK